jgi:hypothetical protein
LVVAQGVRPLVRDRTSRELDGLTMAPPSPVPSDVAGLPLLLAAQQLAARLRTKCADALHRRWPQVEPAASCCRSLRTHPRPALPAAHDPSETRERDSGSGCCTPEARRARRLDTVGCDNTGTVQSSASEPSSLASASAARSSASPNSEDAVLSER